MIRRLRSAILPAAFVLLTVATARAQSLRGIRKDFAEIGERVIPATVTVRSPNAPRGFAGSSGVIVDREGWVLSDSDATVMLSRGPDGKVVESHGPTAEFASRHRTGGCSGRSW